LVCEAARTAGQGAALMSKSPDVGSPSESRKQKGVDLQD
jgi:hypothetical protein